MSNPRQDDLPLESVLAHNLFPGCASIRIKQAAKGLGCCENQVIALIEEGRIYAYDISDGKGRNQKSAGSRTLRRNWRIPVSAFDSFIRQNGNIPSGDAAVVKTPATTTAARAAGTTPRSHKHP